MESAATVLATAVPNVNAAMKLQNAAHGVGDVFRLNDGHSRPAEDLLPFDECHRIRLGIVVPRTLRAREASEEL